MQTPAAKDHKVKSKAVANSIPKETSSETFQFADHRPETVAQRQLQQMADTHSEAIQRKFSIANASPIIQRKNTTGMPDTLKSGIESLSGMDLSDVKVHYNSSQPKQLQAHAYAQGNNIHIAPGQEKHLPHEAWHVVQQKQGRVRPTLQLKGIQVNDNPSLEQEANLMGAKALQMKGFSKGILSQGQTYPTTTQMALITPTYTGVGHSTQVTVDLATGDTMPAGSKPTAVVDGFAKLATLGLTQGADNNHSWVKFHVLNQKAGGSGATASNLTPASQTANHAAAWNAFEKQVKTYMGPAVDNPGGVVVDSIAFKVDVGYYGASTVYWKKNNNSTETTDSSHYPNSVDASMRVKWVANNNFDKTFTANLNNAHGLFKPEDLQNVPNWVAYSDSTHTTAIAGTVV